MRKGIVLGIVMFILACANTHTVNFMRDKENQIVSIEGVATKFNVKVDNGTITEVVTIPDTSRSWSLTSFFSKVFALSYSTIMKTVTYDINDEDNDRAVDVTIDNTQEK